MKILVIGSGGREHAVIRKLSENPEIETIYALPGNGGMKEAVLVPVSAMENDRIVCFALENEVDYVVVTPDDPLAAGLVDDLTDAGIPCFGPDRKAAEIESSKVFAKNLMKKYGIPTAAFETFDDAEEALRYLETASFPIVLKADGLALGKGVLIAMDHEEAVDAVRTIMQDRKFGESGKRMVIEEFLEGPEVSVLSFTDGKTVVPMVSSMDHKKAGDGDTGLNTGGMGTIAPNPFYTEEVAARCMEEIFLPTVRAMREEGRPFKGCLYFGLMITKDGPKVIEYNCRFGDPETEVVLPLLESDLFTVMKAVTDGRLSETEVRFSDRSAACVMLASGGYPGAYEKGFEIDIPEDVEPSVFFAGVKEKDGKLYTNGGRVLGVYAVADTLRDALSEAYAKAARITFEKCFFRKDIGKRALEALERTGEAGGEGASEA
ncbi:MAG: phosphoribosylamine--glycine ligase [Lachnospiraceae bacterium]|nr:phosphoribosylamine--glycine ligase [Lachnospiraceae bacterium]